MILITLFAVVMLISTISAVFRSGEQEGICQYGYKDEENNEE